MEMRVLRVYDREGVLQNTSEPVDQLEHSLAWRPLGNLIASTQRLPHRYQTVFFERNGLRHGEFTLPTDISKVLEMRWNCDSTLLALSVLKKTENGNLPFLQLWNMNNYFWYMKYEIPISTEAVLLSEVLFDPENPLRLSLILSDGTYKAFEFGWINYVSESLSSSSASLAAVVHGPTLFLTPFRYRNIPPPMSGFQIPTEHPILHVAFSGFDEGNTIAALCVDQRVHCFAFAGNFSKAPTLSCTIDLIRVAVKFQVAYRQICFPSESAIYALGHSLDHHQDVLSKFDFSPQTGEITNSKYFLLPEPCIRLALKPFSSLPAVQTNKGEILLARETCDQLEAVSLLTLPEKCEWIQLVSNGPDDKVKVVGLSRRNKLYIDGVLLDSFCTSFSIHNEFVVYSTVDHLARFIPLAAGPEGLAATPEIETYTRNLERGSKIVLSVPHDVSLVLQMPRGNLETVYPRTLLFSSIRESLSKRDYKKAFVLCRKYRIDLNVLFDENPARLMEDIVVFVEQVQDPDFLNLFISSLKEENILASKYPHMTKLPSKAMDSKVNSLCSAIRVVLQGKDSRLYSPSIITTYARQLPPDLEAILRLLKELKDLDPAYAEETLKYAIFLANIDQLFDVALGMYDFELVLMVAQLSQKDPKEYIPFLSELQSLEENYRRFKIDDYLKRYGSALENLAKADRFDECIAYIKKNALYNSGLKIFAGDSTKHNAVMELFGSHLMDNRQYSEAGSAYMSVGNYSQAIVALKKVGEWQRALVCAKRLAFSPDDIIQLVDDVCGYLKHHSRHVEASKLIEVYKKDPEEAVACLLEGHHWEDAIYSCEVFTRTDLLETDVKPAVDAVNGQMTEDIQDMLDQFTKQRHRVHELQNKPPPTIPDTEDPNLDNVDVMSDATSAFTNFTVYTNYSQTTGHSSSQSLGSTKTGKSRRKMERKKNQGKKGSAFEYEYLLGSVSRLVERTNNMHNDLHSLLVALVTLNLLSPAKKLQADFENLLANLEAHLDSIYKVPELPAGLGGLAQHVAPPQVPKPVLSASSKWKLSILSDSE
ncbi:putative elongator complex protein 1, variant 2 [Entomophthora muscae]|uniref:Elongator complex protein 1, variant 2 n=1 Tax=Entomophthora muscae TaxID=34485 RepID=A0ACC2S6R0_9FUNG|nr:putative elongator complex protein 1, variant 2 [Entomophthora muscae]